MIHNCLKTEDYSPYKIKGKFIIIRINSYEIGGLVYFDEFSIIRTISKEYLISSLIKANYPADRMDAIRNNYDLVRDGVAGDKTQEYTEEYLAMQEWRRQAKELANEIMEEYERQHG